MLISDLMQSSAVAFGTSGARGRVIDMTDQVCFLYTQAFLIHLKNSNQIDDMTEVAIAGDLRGSTPDIMKAVCYAIESLGYRTINCGFIPTPALACYAMVKEIPAVMITGSHIPDDRNGIKYYKPDGEILKTDEQLISQIEVDIKDSRFDENGKIIKSPSLPEIDSRAYQHYVKRYSNFFPKACLSGMQVGLYEHSSVARECIYDVLTNLGAVVTKLGFSEKFLPVDTEAIRMEDIKLAKDWCRDHTLESIVSTDGDGDRPLISDENGNWLRGDIAGILCAAYIKADTVVTPVSSNTAVEECHLFDSVKRTRIGSPFVVKTMLDNLNGKNKIVGYEANGGFLTANTIEMNGKKLSALPTRDTLIVIISILAQAWQEKKPVSRLLKHLPQRFTASERLKAFPTEKSRQIIESLSQNHEESNFTSIEDYFSDLCGEVASVDHTDGLRITFKNNEIIHLRPSGNAPEFRCYNEADTEERARTLNNACMSIMQEWINT